MTITIVFDGICCVVMADSAPKNTTPFAGLALSLCRNMRPNPMQRQYYRCLVYSKGVIGGGRCYQRHGDSTNVAGTDQSMNRGTFCSLLCCASDEKKLDKSAFLLERAKIVLSKSITSHILLQGNAYCCFIPLPELEQPAISYGQLIGGHGMPISSSSGKSYRPSRQVCMV